MLVNRSLRQNGGVFSGDFFDVFSRLFGRFFELVPAFFVLSMCSGPTTASPDEKWVATQTRGQTVLNAYRIPVGLHPDEPFRIVVSLKLRNQSVLDALTGAVMADASARRLTNEEFMRDHAPLREHAIQVADYLRSHNFSNVVIAKNRLLISADGSQDAINKAFNTDVRFYNKNRIVVKANATPAMVPSWIAPYVLAVTGLQTMTLSAPEFRQYTIPVSQAAEVPRVVGYELSELVSAYKADRLPSATRATIGVITQGGVTQILSDLNQFAARSGFPLPQVDVVAVGGTRSETVNALGWNTVTQAALAAAGGTVESLVLYNTYLLSDVNLVGAYNRALVDNRAKVVVLSIGKCEADAFHSGYGAAASAIFQAGVAQGVTFVAAAGNTGEAECNSELKGRIFPASSPYVVAVGGTALVASGVTADKKALTVRSLQETAWANSAGGTSDYFQAPEWQESDAKRRVPDLAFNADPDTGAQIMFRGQRERVGGTGLAAALFAGFWARVQSVNDNQLSFPAAALYKREDRSGWFQDVVSGTNGTDHAQPGWDNLTGFGSLNVERFSAGIRKKSAISLRAPFLVNAQPVTGISIPKGGSVMYRFPVLENKLQPRRGKTLEDDSGGAARVGTEAGLAASLSFQLSGGSGNGDVYVHVGGMPTPSSYLMKSASSGNDESIRIKNPLSGIYHVLITAPEEVRGASLLADYVGSVHPDNVLGKGEVVKGIRLNGGEIAIYRIAVPESRKKLSLSLSGGIGDADLYVKYGRSPTVDLYDKRSDGYGSNEQIVVDRPRAGQYYIMVYAFRDARRVMLAADYE